jgi:hypothetical protein
MKPFKDVEANRRSYHSDGVRNSVHRASLTVPEISGTLAEISFLNHFLIKRQYRHVACRVTAVGAMGQRIEAKLFEITEPRVYTIPLTGMTDQVVSTYLVDFFAAENLFIPFPAVMINHRSKVFLNSVHAYNRVLNDIFEDDAINEKSVCEASIDVSNDDSLETFLLFTSGPQRCQGRIHFEFHTAEQTYKRDVEIDMPRLTNYEFRLLDVLPDLRHVPMGTLKVKPPTQPMFFGRILAGQRTADGAFSANHSYYDSSNSDEYWDDRRSSYRTYPFFQDLNNIIRMYPIMAPGRLDLSVILADQNGRQIAEIAVGDGNDVGHPGKYAEINVNACARDAGTDPVALGAFTLVATPRDGKTPTRINHQLVYSAGALASSINVSLYNPNVFLPAGKTGMTWGQVPVGGGVSSRLGIVGGNPKSAPDNLEIAFYTKNGKILDVEAELPTAGSAILDIDTLLRDVIAETADGVPEFAWFVACAKRPDISGFVVTKHLESHHCSGEHSF